MFLRILLLQWATQWLNWENCTETKTWRKCGALVFCISRFKKGGGLLVGEPSRHHPEAKIDTTPLQRETSNAKIMSVEDGPHRSHDETGRLWRSQLEGGNVDTGEKNGKRAVLFSDVPLYTSLALQTIFGKLGIANFKSVLCNLACDEALREFLSWGCWLGPGVVKCGWCQCLRCKCQFHR